MQFSERVFGFALSLKNALRSRTGSLGDITILEQSSTMGRGGRLYNVLASTNVINAGEPVVVLALNASNVQSASTNLLTVNNSPYITSQSYFVGIASTTSTNTSTAVGSVEVVPADSATTYLINANSTTLVNTQAKYNALVGSRVLIDLTSGAYTGLTTDSALNGFIIQALDISRYPGKIAIAPRNGISNLV